MEVSIKNPSFRAVTIVISDRDEYDKLRAVLEWASDRRSTRVHSERIAQAAGLLLDQLPSQENTCDS